jgi:hypothetical protein
MDVDVADQDRQKGQAEQNNQNRIAITAQLE